MPLRIWGLRGSGAVITTETKSQSAYRKSSASGINGPQIMLRFYFTIKSHLTVVHFIPFEVFFEKLRHRYENYRLLFLLYRNKSCTLFTISILPLGYTRTLSIKRQASAEVSPAASVSSFVMLLRRASFSFASCSRFACAVSAA